MGHQRCSAEGDVGHMAVPLARRRGAEAEYLMSALPAGWGGLYGPALEG